MMRIMMSLVVTMLMTGSVIAHHSFAGRFDESRALNLQGMVERVEWTNPHSHIYLNVRTESGTFEQWALEGPSAFQVQRMGLDQQIVKAGDALGVCGYAATGAARKLLSAAVLMLPSGETRLWSNYRQGKCGIDH